MSLYQTGYGVDFLPQKHTRIRKQTVGIIYSCTENKFIDLQGRIQGGHGARPPPPKIGKNMIFLRKIVIFHRKYPQNFLVSLRSPRLF